MHYARVIFLKFASSEIWCNKNFGVGLFTCGNTRWPNLDVGAKFRASRENNCKFVSLTGCENSFRDTSRGRPALTALANCALCW